jgi:hypothetical protein
MTQQHYALAGTHDARVQAALEREFPHWQIWIVYKAVSPKSWNARRWEDVDAIPARVINASSAVELAEAIEDQITSGEQENDGPGRAGHAGG